MQAASITRTPSGASFNPLGMSAYQWKQYVQSYVLPGVSVTLALLALALLLLLGMSLW